MYPIAFALFQGKDDEFKNMYREVVGSLIYAAM